MSVTSDRWVHGQYSFLKIKFEEVRNEIEVWFQHVVAAAHTVRKSMDVLMEMFLRLIIFLRGDVRRPSPSSDLSSCDYFLWGNAKAEVYKHRPTSIDGLKNSGRNTARNDSWRNGKL